MGVVASEADSFLIQVRVDPNPSCVSTITQGIFALEMSVFVFETDIHGMDQGGRACVRFFAVTLR